MAQQTINNGDSASSVRSKINSNFTELYTNSLQLANSIIYPDYDSYQAVAQNTSGNGQQVLEFLNLGNPHANSEDRNLVPGGIYRATGSVIMSRNTKFNQADQRWEYVLSTASAYGANWAESGGEGFNIMAAPVGTHPYQMQTGGINFSVRANGLRSVTGYTSGYVNQTMAPIIGVYESSASGLGQWNPATSAEPIFSAMSEEAKGTENEYYRAETNAASASAFPAFYFAKSRGTYGTKVAVATNDILGFIGFKGWEGDEYEIPAGIRAVVNGTVSNNTLPTQLEFQTSETDSAGRATRMTILANGNIIMHALPTASAGLAAGTLWNDSGTLKVAA